VQKAQCSSSHGKVVEPIRTLLIEDSSPALRALVNLLETHSAVEIVGTAADGATGLKLAGKLRPDLVIADLEMVGLGGLEVARMLRKRFPALRLVVVSIHDGLTWLNLSRANGADAFLSKHRVHAELLELIDRLFTVCAQS